MSLPAHLGQLKACTSCLSKYGETGLAREADRILALFQPETSHYCFNCKELVLAEPDGGYPCICRSCLAKGKEAIATS